jgi:hypothetical protein
VGWADVGWANADGADVDGEGEGVGVGAGVVGGGVDRGVVDWTGLGCVAGVDGADVDGEGEGEGEGVGVGAGVVGGAAVGWAEGTEGDVGPDEGSAVVCTGCVGVANDCVGVAVTPAIGCRPPGEPLAAARGAGRTEACAEPIIWGAAPLLLRLPPLRSFDEAEDAPGGTDAGVLSRKRGWTKPSTSSTTSNPTPATAARRALTALRALAGPLPRCAPRLPRRLRRRPTGAPACLATACLNRLTSAASVCPRSFLVMNPTPLMASQMTSTCDYKRRSAPLRQARPPARCRLTGGCHGERRKARRRRGRARAGARTPRRCRRCTRRTPRVRRPVAGSGL